MQPMFNFSLAEMTRREPVEKQPVRAVALAAMVE
jgi:hypothetical protein